MPTAPRGPSETKNALLVGKHTVFRHALACPSGASRSEHSAQQGSLCREILHVTRSLVSERRPTLRPTSRLKRGLVP